VGFGDRKQICKIQSLEQAGKAGLKEKPSCGKAIITESNHQINKTNSGCHVDGHHSQSCKQWQSGNQKSNASTTKRLQRFCCVLW
jgi:hypothetical protein